MLIESEAVAFPPILIVQVYLTWTIKIHYHKHVLTITLLFSSKVKDVERHSPRESTEAIRITISKPVGRVQSILYVKRFV